MDLMSLYNKVVKGEISIQDASDFMTQPEVKNLINVYINKDRINDLIQYTEEDMQNILAIINITQFIYNNSGLDTGLSDNDYDILYSILNSNTGLDVISSPLLPNISKMVENHKYPQLRGTLSKVYYLDDSEESKNKSRKYLDDWISSMERKYKEITGDTINLNNEDVYVFPKFDGLSAIFEMDKSNNINKVLTRGFTENNTAVDISKNFKSFKREVSEKSDYGLKTEVMMKESDLKRFNKKFNCNYKNTRSVVSAILNSEESDPVKNSFLTIVPLRVGYSDGKQMLAKEVFDYPYIRCKLSDRKTIRKFAEKNKYIDGELRCDGSVIYIIDEKIQNILGRENFKNNFEVAYKFTEESTLSKLKDVEFNVGLFGRIAPIAVVKPVKLKGNTISKVSLGSIGRLKELKLKIGDDVKVLYDIIPYLTVDDDCVNKGDKKIKIPKKCPICGHDLKASESGDILSCDNKSCPSIIKGKILNYLFKMKIDGLSYGVIDKLYDEDIVTSITDLYDIEKKVSDIINIDGFGIQMVNNWIESINSKLSVYDYVFLGSLGIEGISKKTFMNICKVYDIDELLDICDDNKVSKLITIAGIKDKTAIKIITNLKDNKKLIKKLSNKLNIINSKNIDTGNKKKFCFSKIRDTDMEKYIEDKGGIVLDSLTKDVDYLVVPDINANSTKIEKAKKYGIEIITMDKIKEILK